MASSEFVTVIGGIAGTLTVFNLLPQYLKVMKSRHAHDLSSISFITISCSALLWVAYGILKPDVVIIMANSPVFFFAVSILWMKLKYG